MNFLSTEFHTQQLKLKAKMNIATKKSAIRLAVKQVTDIITTIITITTDTTIIKGADDEQKIKNYTRRHPLHDGGSIYRSNSLRVLCGSG